MIKRVLKVNVTILVPPLVQLLPKLSLYFPCLALV